MMKRFFTTTVGDQTGGGGEISALRLNCGGGGEIETSLGTFLDDAGYYDVGSTFGSASAIANTIDDELYQTERFRGSSAIMTYTYSGAPNGTYTIRLHFAELFHQTVGSRVFDVSINGVLFLDNYDIVAVAGGRFIAVIEETVINVTGNSISIAFDGIVDNGKINGIEFIQTA